MNKKLIFVVSCPRSGSTLLLSYLCGLLNTKILYETNIFTNVDSKTLTSNNYNGVLDSLGKYFDSFEEEVIIEKTPEHVFHLQDIEALRSRCKRDIHVIYIIRSPIPTVLSLLECSKKNPDIWGEMDLLGACEKYEESLISIYHNLILKSNRNNTPIVTKNIYGRDILNNLVKVSSYKQTIITPYSICVNYKYLVEDPYNEIEYIFQDLGLDVNLESLIHNRISNMRKVLPLVETEEHHSNIFKSTEEVEEERLTKIVARVDKGIKDRFITDFNYIRNYFEHPVTKETIYDLVVSKKVLRVEENPLVAVVVPLYNKEKYIIETLNSLVNQTYKNIKIILINDASTDNGYKLAKEYISYLDSEDKQKFDLSVGTYSSYSHGVSCVRNRGIGTAINILKADIVSFCDADDLWDTELVEKSVETFKRYPCIDCVYSRILKQKEDKLIEDKSKICNGNVFSDAIQYNFLGCGSNLFIKSKLLENNEDLRFDESYSGCEDWDFLIQLSKVANFKCTKEYLVTYRQVEDSLSCNTKNQFDQGRNILKRYSETEEKYRRLVTRLFFFYFSHRNFTWENIKELDFKFILEIVLNKCKSFVKSYIS